jgi:hypothetical protein
MKRFYKRVFSIIGIFLMLYGFIPLDVVVPWLMTKASAAGEVTREFNITYGAGTQGGHQGVYSAKQNYNSTDSDAPSINILAEPGKKIKSVELVRDGATISTITDPIGKASWSGKISTSGVTRNVLSKENDQTKTYFAWYRYSNTSPDTNWNANEYDENGNLLKFNQGSSDTESIGGVNMPKYPGGTAPVVFGTQRTKPYFFADSEGNQSGEPFPSHLVKVIGFGNINVIRNVLVEGPEGTMGRSQDTEERGGFNPISNVSISVNERGTGPEFYIRYTQKFDDYPDALDPGPEQLNRISPSNSAVKFLGAPGARLMTYFGAFSFNIKGETYKHPDKVRVTYEDVLIPEPDLGSISLTSPAFCMEAGSIGQFTVRFANNGSGNTTKSLDVQVKNGSIIVTTRTFSSMNAGTTQTFDFTAPLSSAGVIEFTVVLDSGSALVGGIGSEVNRADNTRSFSFDVKSIGGCTGEGPEIIEGELEIEKTTMPFGNSNSLRAKNVKVSGGANCSAAEVKIATSQNGGNKSDWTSSGSFSVSFGGPPYPGGVGGGYVDVTLTIKTTCGTERELGRGSFEITIPADNNPPVFQPGWFHRGNNSNYPDIYEIVVGSYVDLGIIHDNTRNPSTPYDPEGDDIMYTWDFASSSSAWVRELPDQYGLYKHDEKHRNIRADVLGNHTVYGTATDRRGATTSRRSATLSVIPDKPIPVITVDPDRPFASCGDLSVKSRRAVPAKYFDGSKSYSPSGKPIVEYKWTNKLTMYINDISEPTRETVRLAVKDSAGNWSEYEAVCNITVLPDEPPIAKGVVPPLAVRPQVGMSIHPVFIENRSYSPDGDPITSASYRYKYDRNNNGFSDDEWLNAPGGTLAGLNFIPTRVGKYFFEIRVCDDYAGCDDTSDEPPASYTLDVVNNAPEVSFKVEGDNPQPDFEPVPEFTGSMILDNWELYQVNSLTRENNQYWYPNVQNGLSIGMGIRAPTQEPWSYSFCPGGSACAQYSGMSFLNDNGLGNNRLSPWRAMQSASYQTPILIPYVGGSNKTIMTDVHATPTEYRLYEFENYEQEPMKSNKKYLFIPIKETIWDNRYDDYRTASTNGYVFAWNQSKTPEYQYVTTTGPGWVSSRATWKGGSHPYDFILKPFNNAIRTYYKVPATYYWNSDNYTTTANVLESYMGTQHLISDTYIVGVSILDHPSAVYIDSDDEYNIKERYNIYDIRVYDAYEGRLLNEFRISEADFDPALPQYPKPSISLNHDKLVFHWDNDTITWNGQGHVIDIRRMGRYWEYDLNGNFLTTYERMSPLGSLEQPQSSNIRLAAMYRDWTYGVSPGPEKDYICTPVGKGPLRYDGEGNSYQYYETYCSTDGGFTHGIDETLNPGTPAGMSLIKRDRNGSILWEADLRGQSATSSAAHFVDQKNSGRYMLAMDPVSRQLITKTFYTYTPSGSIYPLKEEFSDVVHMDTGASWPAGTSLEIDSQVPSVSPVTGWDSSGCTYTVEGAGTGCASPFGTGSSQLAYDGGIATTMTETGKWTYSEYFGDGFMVDMYQKITYWAGPGGSQTSLHLGKMLTFVRRGTPTTSPEVYSGFKLGQFVSPSSYENVDITFQLTLDEIGFDAGKLAGMSFRMTDPRNRYALETDGSTLFISRYVNGNRVVLNQLGWFFPRGIDHMIRIRTVGGIISVFVNGAPALNAADGMYTSGKLGPFTNRGHVSFGTITVKEVKDTNVWVSGYAILGEDTGKAVVRYSDVAFADPENDPRAGTFRWTFSHTPKFLNNQGVETTPTNLIDGPLEFTKVGEYDLKLSAYDDPHPDYLHPSNVFGSYRKESNTYTQKLIVHRRPLAIYDIVQNEDGTISWVNDWSYDPDRFAPFNASNPQHGTASNEETGINYAENRGVLDREYWYIDPDGNVTYAQLSRPQKLGKYTVAMRVRDEYGAWSEPAIQTIVSGTIAPPNHPPTASMRLPSGTQGSPTIVRTTTPYIEWNQNDADPGTLFSEFHLQVMNEGGNIVLDTGALAQGPTAATIQGWTMSTNLPANQKLQTRVRVNDGMDWSDWSAATWLMVNRLPIAEMIHPDGTQTVPTITSELRPTFTWRQTDADPGTIFTHFQLQITNEANNLMLHDSGEHWQHTSSNGSYTVPTDLPTRQKLRVRVRVLDGFEWSNYSDQTWITINRPPAADFDWLPKPVWEGDTAAFTNLSSDLDGDVLTAAWSITKPDGSSVSFNSWDMPYKLDLPGHYTVTLTVSDGLAASTVTKIVTASELRLRSEVHHTPKWLQYHQEKGHRTTTPPKDFYSGEILVVQASVSPAPIDRVTARIDTTGEDGQPIAAEVILTQAEAGSLYEAELFDEVWMEAGRGLPEGGQFILFRVKYRNGVMKEERVPIHILGNVFRTVGVHRLQ